MYKKIINNLSWLTANEIIGSLLGFIFYVILARQLGTLGVGTYSYVISFIWIYSLFFDLGLSTYYLRKWSHDKSNLNNDLKILLGTYVILLIPLTLVFIGYTFLFEKDIAIYFILSFIFSILDLLRKIPVTYATSQNKFKDNLIINSSERFISMGISIVLLLLGFPLLPVFISIVFGRFVSFLISLKTLNILILPKFKIEPVKKILITSFPLFLVNFVGLVYYRVDIVLVKYLTNLELVGLYSATYRIIELIIIFPGLIATASLPTLVHLYKKNNLEDIQTLFHSKIRFLTSIALLVTFFIFVYAKDIIVFIYGPSYENAAGLLILLSLALLPIFINVPLARYLLANHSEKYLMWAFFVTLIINIILDIILIPIIGYGGAAIGTLIAELVLLVLCIRKVNVHISITKFYFPIISTAIFLIALMIIHPAFYIGIALFILSASLISYNLFRKDLKSFKLFEQELF